MSKIDPRDAVAIANRQAAIEFLDYVASDTFADDFAEFVEEKRKHDRRYRDDG